MTRRKLLALLAGLPLVGRFVPQGEIQAARIVEPQGGQLYLFLLNENGIWQCSGHKSVLLSEPILWPVIDVHRNDLEKEYPS